jgi:hypothetical protein
MPGSITFTPAVLAAEASVAIGSGGQRITRTVAVTSNPD